MAETKLLEPETYKKLGSHCFNATWDLIDKTDRSPDEALRMLNEAHASLWFWENYDKRTATNLSIGLWQVARVYALLGDGDMAQRYGEKCVSVSADPQVDGFYLAYGHEAVARSHKLKGESRLMEAEIAKARTALAASKLSDTSGLTADLAELLR